MSNSQPDYTYNPYFDPTLPTYNAPPQYSSYQAMCDDFATRAVDGDVAVHGAGVHANPCGELDGELHADIVVAIEIPEVARVARVIAVFVA